MNLAKRLRIFLLLFMIAVCFYFGRFISLKDQWPLYEALRTTAAIIFAVMGAWIALIYPNALKKVFDKNRENRKEGIEQVNTLLSPMIYSTLILGFVLLIGILWPIFKQLHVLMLYRNVLRGISYSFLGGLTSIQIWTLLLSLIPAEIVKQDLNKAHEEHNFLEKMQSRIKK